MVVIVYCNCILWQKENVSNYLECLGIALKYISNFFSGWWKWWKELIFFFFFLRCCRLYSVNHKTIIVNSLIYLKPEGWHLRSMDCVSAWSLTQERREYFSAVPHKRETLYFLQLDWFFFSCELLIWLWLYTNMEKHNSQFSGFRKRALLHLMILLYDLSQFIVPAKLGAKSYGSNLPQSCL